MAAKKKTAQEPAVPWCRQPGEPTTAYAVFSAFRDFPYQDRSNILQAYVRRDRPLKEIAKLKGCSASTVETMSSKFHWTDRAAAYDEHLDEIHRQEQESEIIQMRQLHAKIAQQMVNKAARKFLVISESDMSVSDAIKMFEVGVKYERLSRGDTTDNQNINVKENIAYRGMESLVKSLDKARAKLMGG